jgi:hypothetical protein
MIERLKDLAWGFVASVTLGGGLMFGAWLVAFIIDSFTK